MCLAVVPELADSPLEPEVGDPILEVHREDTTPDGDNDRLCGVVDGGESSNARVVTTNYRE